MFIEAAYERPDPRAECAARMARNGSHLGKPANNESADYYCVDGKVWLITPERSVLLGCYFLFMNEVRLGIRAVSPPGD
jgi:hypothetical protein